MRRDVVVDGGQTGLRLGLVDGAGVDRVVDAAGFTYVPSADGVADDVRTLSAALAELRTDVDRVCLGLTNAPASDADRRRLAAALRDAVGAREVWVTSDVVTAHAGALAGAEGVVTLAGTGAVCLGVTASGSARSDGFGYLLGDEGSGFAVGRAGLRAALRATERRGPATSLTDAMHRRFAAVADFPHGLYRRAHPVGDIAAFATDVSAAARAGDAVARSVLSDAVDALVCSTVSVLERCPGLAPTPALSYFGGLFNDVEHVGKPFADRLAAVSAAVVTPPVGDALDGAARLLGEGGRYHQALVTRAGRSDPS